MNRPMAFGAPPKARLLLLALPTLAALLVGCETAQAPVQLPAEHRPRPAEPAPVEDERIDRLLEAAAQALAEDRLTTPESDSALSFYQAVLALDPDDQRAQRGFEKIVERYVKLALTAADRQRYAQGRLMLERAREVDPAHPAIAPTERQLDLLENARRDKVRLDAGALAERASAVQSTLKRLGRRASEGGCRVNINARSDAEGRWVYQQLNSGAGDARVRARLTVASPPTVELTCFSEEG
ncbi:MAG: hypothetical protein F4Z45_01735 [Gammaproteobacteria bacterium]|nr:hypothetical protein [Gammaproteobacteria bacterium]